MKRRPRVAFLTSLVPYPPPLNGTMLRVARLSAELSEEFDVAVVCQSGYEPETLASNWNGGRPFVEIISVPKPVPDPRRDALWGSPAEVIKSTLATLLPNRPPRIFNWSWSDRFVGEIRQLLNRRQIDVVWATKSWNAEMARTAGAERIIVDIDDFQGDLLVEQLDEAGMYFRKPFQRLQARHLVRYERDLPGRFTSVAVCKPEDITHLAAEFRERVHVVPNGVDVPDTVLRNNVRGCEMLFVGTLGWEPNVKGLTSFMADVLPAIQRELPDTRLIVAGRGPIPDDLARLLNRRDVELHESPVSLEQFYERAAISVIPLLSGGGTSIKTIESLAYALPTVATSIAARGLGMEHGRHLLIADSASEMAQHCIRLLKQPDDARALGENGRDEVGRRLSWRSAGVQARSVVRELLAASAG